jgi:hypothetical protein
MPSSLSLQEDTAPAPIYPSRDPSLFEGSSNGFLSSPHSAPPIPDHLSSSMYSPYGEFGRRPLGQDFLTMDLLPGAHSVIPSPSSVASSMELRSTPLISIAGSPTMDSDSTAFSAEDSFKAFMVRQY